MEYLGQEKNNNFYVDKDRWLRNINLPNEFLERYEPTSAPISYYFNLCDLKQYKTGVLVKKSDFSSQKFTFYTNDGKILLNIERNKRDNPGFMDMDAYVCESGILVAIQNSITGREYLYKFYEGWMNWSDDFEKLKRMVDFRDNFKKNNTERNQ